MCLVNVVFDDAKLLYRPLFNVDQGFDLGSCGTV